nr:unnamed protein product [Callosobruchus chinensis]
MDNFDVEVLIEAVRSRPILWDCSHEEYKKRIKKKDSWTEVCTAVYPDFLTKSDMDKNNIGNDVRAELTATCSDVANILRQAGFILRKWVSNDPDIVQNISHNDSDTELLKLGSNENSKTLGRSTKLSILSGVSQIYDPLGLLSACIISVKILLQKLWSEKVNWDESVAIDLHTKWKYLDGDASQDAYVTCIYIRSTNQEGTAMVRLLCAKSKVSPLKTLTIPRLELQGALLMSKLATKFSGGCIHHPASQKPSCPKESLIYDKQHPILLPNAHRFVELLFKYEHNRLIHAGPTQLLSSVRERFWPISGKLTAKRIQLMQHLWSRWSPEYIHELQVRKKWKRECHNLQKGSLVLIKEKNQPPLCWALGRVIEVHFGKDNVPRVVTLRTTKGTIRRAAVKSPLPLACDDLQLSQPQFPVESTSFQSGGVYGAPSSQRPSFRAHERVPDRP